MDVTDEVNGASGINLPLQLPPAVHNRLTQWCRETAELLDTTGVARGDVIEALIDNLLSDPDTSTAIRNRLAGEPGGST